MKTIPTVLLALLVPACSDGDTRRPETGPDTGAASAVDRSRGDSMPAASVDATGDRPERRTDTMRLEGMAEPVRLVLARAPTDFPIRFSAYVPDDMTTRFSTEGDGAVMDVVAEFGGVRNDLAFVHLYVFPEGTSEQAAESAALAYEAGHGLPVSQGLEPLSGDEATARMPWARTAYRFRYQARGQWFAGTLGIGRHAGRHFLLVRHYPAEYAEGFAPRADLVLRTWVWADGSRLHPSDGR